MLHRLPCWNRRWPGSENFGIGTGEAVGPGNSRSSLQAMSLRITIEYCLDTYAKMRGRHVKRDGPHTKAVLNGLARKLNGKV